VSGNPRDDCPSFLCISNLWLCCIQMKHTLHPMQSCTFPLHWKNESYASQHTQQSFASLSLPKDLEHPASPAAVHLVNDRHACTATSYDASLMLVIWLHETYAKLGSNPETISAQLCYKRARTTQLGLSVYPLQKRTSIVLWSHEVKEVFTGEIGRQSTLHPVDSKEHVPSQGCLVE
jgi:hypothetical protein